MDRVAQFKAILTGVEITKELDLLKAKGVAAITALLDRQDAIAEDERVASLVRTFVFAAKLAATGSDDLMDTNGYNKVTGLMIGIANALDATGSGRAALAVLLDNADNRVRAFAGVYSEEIRRPIVCSRSFATSRTRSTATMPISMRIAESSAGSKRASMA